MLMAGFLPFSAIYIELFYIYSSVWGHTYYTLYGILCLVFVILNIVTACITVALTYFQLSMEDHRWWWTAFINGGYVLRDGKGEEEERSRRGKFIYNFFISFFSLLLYPGPRESSSTSTPSSTTSTTRI
jgi:hypothetical protein